VGTAGRVGGGMVKSSWKKKIGTVTSGDVAPLKRKLVPGQLSLLKNVGRKTVQLINIAAGGQQMGS